MKIRIAYRDNDGHDLYYHDIDGASPGQTVRFEVPDVVAGLKKYGIGFTAPAAVISGPEPGFNEIVAPGAFHGIDQDVEVTTADGTRLAVGRARTTEDGLEVTFKIPAPEDTSWKHKPDRLNRDTGEVFCTRCGLRIFQNVGKIIRNRHPGEWGHWAPAGDRAGFLFTCPRRYPGLRPPPGRRAEHQVSRQETQPDDQETLPGQERALVDVRQPQDQADDERDQRRDTKHAS